MRASVRFAEHYRSGVCQAVQVTYGVDRVRGTCFACRAAQHGSRVAGAGAGALLEQLHLGDESIEPEGEMLEAGLGSPACHEPTARSPADVRTYTVPSSATRPHWLTYSSHHSARVSRVASGRARVSCGVPASAPHGARACRGLGDRAGRAARGVRRRCPADGGQQARSGRCGRPRCRGFWGTRIPG